MPFVFTLDGKDGRGRELKGKDFVLNNRYRFKKGKLTVQNDDDGAKIARNMRYYSFVKVRQLVAQSEPEPEEVVETESEVAASAPSGGRSRKSQD